MEISFFREFPLESVQVREGKVLLRCVQGDLALLLVPAQVLSELFGVHGQCNMQHGHSCVVFCHNVAAKHFCDLLQGLVVNLASQKGAVLR